jgi:ribosomal protein S6--L-glutamate ligase
VLDSLWRVGDEVVVQQFVNCSGESRRLLVVGSNVVAAARFSAPVGDWRSNASRGGVADALQPDRVSLELARRAAAGIGLGICGVDLLPTANGPVVCEVNPTPGFAALERATGIDVAGEIVAHLAAR